MIDFSREVIVNVFGLPIAVGKAEVVDEGGIDDDAFTAKGVEGVFRHERPVAPTSAMFEEGLEGRADGGFVRDAKTGELVKGGVVGLDGSVGGFEV